MAHTSPEFSKVFPNFQARKFVSPKNFRTIAVKSGKTPNLSHLTDGAYASAQNPARPIAPGTLALKFFTSKIFWIEISRAEKISARNLKIRKYFGLKFENPKKSGAKVGKKGVSSATDSLPRRRPARIESPGI